MKLNERHIFDSTATMCDLYTRWNEIYVVINILLETSKGIESAHGSVLTSLKNNWCKRYKNVLWVNCGPHNQCIQGSFLICVVWHIRAVLDIEFFLQSIMNR